MGSRSWRRRLARALTASVPFVVIVGVFAAAVAWHLGGPGRQLAEFRRLVEDDAPLAHDYGDAAVVAMERKSSLGSRPAYVVRIHGSGEVEFEGKAFVCVMHPMSDRVLRVTAQRLIDAMVRVGFDREPRRRPAAPDRPRAVVALAHDASVHELDDDDGRADTPVVAEIERQIDRVAGTARWKRIPRNDGAHVPFCPGPDGSKKVFDATGRLVPELATAEPAEHATRGTRARQLP
jgi:hypothetical protein